MKPSKAPKYIHDFLITKGFGYERKLRIYMTRILDSPVNACIFFTKQNELYEIDFGICYPNKSNSSGAFINPRQASTLLPNTKLLMASDYDSDDDIFWDFSDQKDVVEKLCINRGTVTCLIIKNIFLYLMLNKFLDYDIY